MAILTCTWPVNSAFSRDTFLDTQVAFSGFPHIPGTCTAFLHVVGLCRIFSHQIMCVHPSDALKIPDFPGTFTQTWVFCFGFWYILKMLQKFHIFPGHLPRHRGFLFRVFRTLHHADAPDFLRTFTQTPFFWVFCTSPGHVLNGVWVNVGGNMLFSFRIFTHQCIMQMLRKFHIVPGHLYGHQGCFCQMFRTSPWHVLDLTCWCQVAYFYFGDLDANLFVNMLWMLQVFRIFPGRLPGQQGCFTGFSAHPQNMYYICMCC